nr:MAG TPA: hypothetical protein [Caudoviricetes sp.]
MTRSSVGRRTGRTTHVQPRPSLTQRFRLRTRTDAASATIRAIFCHRFLLHVSILAFPYISR